MKKYIKNFYIAIAILFFSGCNIATAPYGSPWSAGTLTIDFATYNPLSLVVRDKGLIEAVLGDYVTVDWIQSAGSNRANELLRAGALDFGSTAGSAALLARSNGSPIQIVYVFSQPEWTALVTTLDSEITSVADLYGRSVAATRGTDPYFFLLQALEEYGIDYSDVEVVALQHADGRTALSTGSVDAWAGLDPIMGAAQYESGNIIFHRNLNFNTFGVLNSTESFINNHPDLVQVVIDAYEQARIWAIENPNAVAELLAYVAAIDIQIASTVINERTNFISPIPGYTQRPVLERVGTIFVESGDVISQQSVNNALDTLFAPQFAERILND